MTTATQTTTLTREQLPEAAAVLARAFDDDPLFTYIIPEGTPGRADKLRWFMGRGAAYGHRYGEVYTTAGKVEGNAVWLPPGETKMSPVRMVRMGLFLLPLKFGMSAGNRFMNVMDFVEKIHHDKAPERHWYLMILGVDPPRQGQGVGGALIQPILARADAEGLPCYLETKQDEERPLLPASRLRGRA